MKVVKPLLILCGLMGAFPVIGVHSAAAQPACPPGFYPSEDQDGYPICRHRHHHRPPPDFDGDRPDWDRPPPPGWGRRPPPDWDRGPPPPDFDRGEPSPDNDDGPPPPRY